MTTDFPRLDEMRPDAPDMDAVRARYAAFQNTLEAAPDAASVLDTVHAWEHLRRELSHWSTCVSVRFSLDTRDAENKAARELADTLEPEIIGLENTLKQALLDSPHRPELEAELGSQAFELWKRDLASFAPEVQDLLVEENRLISRYSEVISSLSVEFEGKPHNLPQLMAYRERADRDLRYRAVRAVYEGLAEIGSEVDAIFDDLVELRHRIATTLGYPSFVELGYQRMKRIDYGETEVKRFRAGVSEHIVPLVERVHREQARRLGLDRLMGWDRLVYSPHGNPEPGGDHRWMMDAAEAFFDDFDPRFAELYRLMRGLDLLDLDAREGKQPGGYCNIFYEHGLPFIFANFQKTTADISVFTHEMGHAFQFWRSRELPLLDYFFATIETAEIPSMSLEYLTLPYLSHFLAERADEFTWIHLASSLTTLPWTAIGDDFQHWVYRNPEATPEERRAHWQELERIYQPDLDYGELSELISGRTWHVIGHFFFAPFYYIDYALAGTVAMQMWTLALDDREEAMRRYIKLCNSGGSRPFQDTLNHIDMPSPFALECLETIAATAEAELFS